MTIWIQSVLGHFTFVYFYSFNLRAWEVPPCVPVCTEPIPKAPPYTNLVLKSVIPRTSPKEYRNYTEYGNEENPMYSGDRLVYECNNETLGVHGGVDRQHDTFR